VVLQWMVSQHGLDRTVVAHGMSSKLETSAINLGRSGVGSLWCHNYFHWMFQALPRLAVLQASGVEFDRRSGCVEPFRCRPSFRVAD
jgi:hypothetical protein